MAAGFKYDLKPMEVTREMCRVDTIQRLSGGVNFEDSDVPVGTLLMPLTPLAVDLKTRKAKAVKNVRVVEKVTSGTKVKVSKYSLAFVGMFLSDGTTTVKVNAIDKSTADYDTLTVSAAITPDAGDVLFEAAASDGKTPKYAANMLNYATTKVEAGATVTPIIRAFEVCESKLYAPIAEVDKATLTDRFFFIP
ncbi:MAG: hypothetical protein IKJ48_07640 [Alistipes sp.]|nr:hypothetical protein [Alistipes sp.]